MKKVKFVLVLAVSVIVIAFCLTGCSARALAEAGAASSNYVVPPSAPTPTPVPGSNVEVSFDSWVTGTAIESCGDSTWTIPNIDANAIADISEAQSQAGGKSLRLLDNSTAQGATARKAFISAQSSGSIRVHFYSTATKAYITVGTGTGSTQRFIDLTLSTSNKIQYRLNDNTNSSDLAGGTYSPNTWNYIDIAWTSTSSYSLALNGGTAVTGLSPVNSANVPTMIYFKAGDNAATGSLAYFDTITFTPPSMVQ